MCKFCSFAAKAAPGSNPNHLGAHLLTAVCPYLSSAEARADSANVHVVRQHLEARQGLAGPSQEVGNNNVARLLLEWLLHDGLPLTIVESDAFLEFVRALKPDWTPPSRYLLSHRMMLDVFQGVFTAVVERVETQPFVAMSVDGWSKDLGSAHCLAWCAAWWGQAYLVDCVNTEANSVTAAYLLSKFEETMTKHNLEGKVCALVTDTPSTHKALWRLVEEKYPKVLGLPCHMHVQDLYLKDLLTLELVIKHCEIVRDIIKYYTLSSSLAQQLEVFQNLHNIRKGLELSGGVRMHSCSSMLSSLQVNKPALCSAVTDASFLRPGLTATQQQRAGSIRAVVLSPNFWAENELLLNTMRPVVQLQIDLQTDNVNNADAYYGVRAVHQWYQQQASSTEAVHLSPISSPADWVASGPLRSLHACLATPTSTPLQPTVLTSPTPTTPSQPGAQLGHAPTTPSQLGSQPDPVPSVVLSGPPGPLAAVYFAPQLTTDPVRWWRLHGDFASELQTVAQRVLCIPSTAAANERVFSAFSHVWSDKRASLILGRMWIMAYIYFNKRVLERKPKTLSDADWEEYERWMRKTPQDQS